jgi:hypothetical protein
MSAPQDDERGEGRGRVDLTSLLYIAGGIPAIIAYVVLSFVLARFFSFPA